MNGEIKIHTDKTLLALGRQWASLSSEQTGFLLSKEDTNQEGRTMKNVASDMIAVYKQANEYLKNHYPDNEVAKAWIATNEFCALLLKETWL